MGTTLGRNVTGASAPEYVLMVALVALAALGAWAALGDGVSEKADCAARAIAGSGAPCSPGGAVAGRRASLDEEEARAAREGLAAQRGALTAQSPDSEDTGEDAAATTTATDLGRALDALEHNFPAGEDTIDASDVDRILAEQGLRGSFIAGAIEALDTGAGRGDPDGRISLEDIGAVRARLAGEPPPARDEDCGTFDLGCHTGKIGGAIAHGTSRFWGGVDSGLDDLGRGYDAIADAEPWSCVLRDACIDEISSGVGHLLDHPIDTLMDGVDVVARYGGSILDDGRACIGGDAHACGEFAAGVVGLLPPFLPAELAFHASGGRGLQLPDRTRGLEPLLGKESLEVLANLPYPPGNVTVSRDGRIFFTYFPATNRGSVKVAELVNGHAVPFPSGAFQDDLRTVLAARVDRQDRLWMLDFADHGLNPAHHPRLVAVDIHTKKTVASIELPPFAIRRLPGFPFLGVDMIAPPGSLLNDFQVSDDGKTIFIGDQSVLGQRSGILVVDLHDAEHPAVTRRLDKHISVQASRYETHVAGKRVVANGMPLRMGIDGMTTVGPWLYYAPLNGGSLYRIRSRDLANASLTDAQIAGRVERVGAIPMSDGMTSDRAGNIYLTDMERSQIVRVDTRNGHRLDVLVRDGDQRTGLRWPDGFAWTPEGDMLVTASALHQNLPHVDPKRSVPEHGPYQIFRLSRESLAQACQAGRTCAAWPAR